MAIKTEISNQIATVTLSRPEIHNALNEEMISALTKTFTNLGEDKNVRAIILKAEGKSFCSGADLNWMKSMMSCTASENIEDAKKLGNMFKAIDECPKPVIGRIHGAAFGGGVGLISVCDMTVALRQASFALSETKIGLVPGVISYFVVQRTGVSFARRYFLTSEKISPEEAFNSGLISAIADDEKSLDSVVNNWTESIKRNGPSAVSACKKLICEVSKSNIKDALEFSSKLIAECRVSKEGQEGMKAFLEKRLPNWIAN